MLDFAWDALKWLVIPIPEVTLNPTMDFIVDGWEGNLSDSNSFLTESDETENNTLILPNYYFIHLTAKRLRKRRTLLLTKHPFTTKANFEKPEHYFDTQEIYKKAEKFPVFTETNIKRDIHFLQYEGSISPPIVYETFPPRPCAIKTFLYTPTSKNNSKNNTKQSYTNIVNKLNLPTINLPQRKVITPVAIPKMTHATAKKSTPIKKFDDFSKPEKPKLEPKDFVDKKAMHQNPTETPIQPTIKNSPSPIYKPVYKPEKLRYPDYTNYVLAQINHPLPTTKQAEPETIKYPDYTNYVSKRNDYILKAGETTHYSFAGESIAKKLNYPDYTHYFIWQHLNPEKSHQLYDDLIASQKRELRYSDFHRILH